jgi:chemotaxis protein CheD
MQGELLVDMGEYKTADTITVLVSLGLGSCVGVAILDPITKKGGLAHIMLPTSADSISNDSAKSKSCKFADIAIPAMIEELEKKQCFRRRMVAKIAGGAHMFANLPQTISMDIGKRNADAVREQLKMLGIPIIADETGGNLGRTIRFSLETGVLTIKTKEYVKEI